MLKLKSLFKFNHKNKEDKPETKNQVYQIFKHRKLRRSEKIFIGIMIAYPIIHFLVFWVYVNFGTLISTFRSYNPLYDEYTFVGFKNYVTIFKEMVLGEDQALHQMFLNSFYAIGINIVILPLAVISAYAFYKKMPGTTFFSVMFYIPQLVSIVVLTMMYRYMFHGQFGPIAMLIAKMKGVETVDLISTSSNTLWLLIWIYCIWVGLGSNVILIRDAMNKIPKEVSESAILDGCGFFRELFSVALPMSMKTIGIFILMTVMSATSFTMPPMLIAKSMGKNGQFGTIGWMIFANANGGNGTQITMTTMGVLFSLLLTPLIVVVKKIIDRFGNEN